MHHIIPTKAALPVGKTAAISSGLVWRLLVVSLTTLLVAEFVVRLPMDGPIWLGQDYRTYMDATRAWLETGAFYPAYQLAGPYPIVETEILYPPVALWLFAPFTVLPAIAWWAPVPIIAWVVWKQRPSRWQWVAILALLTLPAQHGSSWAVDFIGNGNPGMWTAAFVALATRWPFFGSWVLTKPSMAPFALVGIRNRAWWLGLATFALLCLPFGVMWLDYAIVLRNAQGGGLLYSLPNVTLCFVPLVAAAALGRQELVQQVRDESVSGDVRVDQVTL